MNRILRSQLMLFCSLGILLSFTIATTNIFAQAQSAEPAPVPGAVAIARPTAEEVQLAERSLASFLETADPAVKAINQKYPGLISVRVPPPNSAIIPGLAPFFQSKHQANLEVAKKGDIDVLFMGDSITDFWRSENGNMAGKPVFDKYYGSMKAANFGMRRQARLKKTASRSAPPQRSPSALTS